MMSANRSLHPASVNVYIPNKLQELFSEADAASHLTDKTDRNRISTVRLNDPAEFKSRGL
jgi:hypothetical protein